VSLAKSPVTKVHGRPRATAKMPESGSGLSPSTPASLGSTRVSNTMHKPAYVQMTSQQIQAYRHGLTLGLQDDSLERSIQMTRPVLIAPCHQQPPGLSAI
jgi:hypothetical protein